VIENYKMFIGGEWVESSSGQRLESINPFNQQVWSTIPQGTEEDVEQAIAAARHAFENGWRQTNGATRQKLIFALADLLIENARRMGELETTDNGKVIRETERQMHFAARNYKFLGGFADKIYGEVIPLDNLDLFDYAVREPKGVVALLPAWNSPIQLLTNKLSPALAAGCTVVIKPSETASATTLELAKLAEQAGFPPGVINVVTGDGRTGAALTSSPNVDKVSFTGGPEVARIIASAAAQNLKPTTMELGGKSPHIIFDDANLTGAIPGALAGIFGASGQTCIAGSRLLVQRPVYDQVVEEVAARAKAIKLGNPLKAETEMGPVATKAQFDKVMSYVDVGHQEGARLVAGGVAVTEGECADGYFIAPTVFADVDNNMRIAQEEIFGPFLCIIPFDDEDEAIEIANGTNYGLASGLWTQNLSRAHRIAKRLHAGTVWVNTYRTNAAQAPFGGVKESGYGRERGLASIFEYTYLKNVMIDLSADVGDPFAMRV